MWGQVGNGQNRFGGAGGGAVCPALPLILLAGAATFAAEARLRRGRPLHLRRDQSRARAGRDRVLGQGEGQRVQEASPGSQGDEAERGLSPTVDAD